MAARQLTKMEQAGMAIAVLVVGTFLYLKLVHQAPGRELKGAQKNYARIAGEVASLKKEAETGDVKKAVNRLRKKIERVRDELEQAEAVLALGEEKDRLANTIVRAATNNGLMIQAFGELTDKKSIEEITGKEAVYPQRHYRVVLKGGFESLRQFLSGIDEIPKRVAIRKINLERSEEDAFMRATVWLTI